MATKLSALKGSRTLPGRLSIACPPNMLVETSKVKPITIPIRGKPHSLFLKLHRMTPIRKGAIGNGAAMGQVC